MEGSFRKPSISLQDLLDKRKAPLSETQLWAVCLEGCHAILNYCNSSTDVAVPNESALLISLPSLMLNSDGTVSASLLFDDQLARKVIPSDSYAWQQYSQSSESVHVYSLGAALFAAADYGLSDDEEPALSEELELLFSCITTEQRDERTKIHDLIEIARAGLIIRTGTDKQGTAAAIIEDLVSTVATIPCEITGAGIERLDGTIRHKPQINSRGRNLKQATSSDGTRHALMEEIRSGATKLMTAPSGMFQSKVSSTAPSSNLSKARIKLGVPKDGLFDDWDPHTQVTIQFASCDGYKE